MSNQLNPINVFLITATHELLRQKNVELLKLQLPYLKVVEAIYPLREKVPFLDKLMLMSGQRTGKALNHGEIGVLLSNRKIWRSIASSSNADDDTFLILESDSVINDVTILTSNFHNLSRQYDLFFFGGWFGHIKLLNSTKRKVTDIFTVGEPYIKTICCGYGYALNKKTAKYLLKITSKIGYPVDEFKRYIEPGKIKIGAIVPELISQGEGVTTIGHDTLPSFLHATWMFILDIRNSLISFFK